MKFLVAFPRFRQCKYFEHRAVKLRSIEKHDWHQIFECDALWQLAVSILLCRANYWFTAGAVFRRVSITSSMRSANVVSDLSSLLANQNVLRNSASLLCLNINSVLEFFDNFPLDIIPEQLLHIVLQMMFLVPSFLNFNFLKGCLNDLGRLEDAFRNSFP